MIGLSWLCGFVRCQADEYRMEAGRTASCRVVEGESEVGGVIVV